MAWKDSILALFGRPVDRAGPGLDMYLDQLQALKKPAIALTPADTPSFSWIGGLPALPDHVSWPVWKEKPLAFLGQFDLGAIPEHCDRQGLPAMGVLYFFYNSEQSTWGFDPNDRGSWQVIYAAEVSPDQPPCNVPDGLPQDAIYTKKAVRFRPVDTWPDGLDHLIESLALTDKQMDEYAALCASGFEGSPTHHFLGYPMPVQGNDMDLECQLVTNGLYCGDLTGYQDPRRQSLEPGRSEWVLLLQLDSDDDTGMMWGDCGMLYFWIRKSDLETRRFEQCWMILQCC